VAGTERLPYGASPDLRSHRRRTAVRLESISAKNIRPHCSASKNKFRCIQKALSVYHPFSDQAWLANKHDGLCSSSFSWKPSILSDSATVSTGSSRTVTYQQSWSCDLSFWQCFDWTVLASEKSLLFNILIRP